MTKTGKSSTSPVPLAWLTLVVFAAAALFTGTVTANGGHDPWLTDFDKALAVAKKLQRPILLVFSGSDWCAWCMRLHNEVLSKKAFTDWARDKMVLCLLDFPSNKALIPPEQLQKNLAILKRFEISGFPTVLLLHSDGSLITRTGYRRGGANAYVKHLEELLEKGGAWRDKLRKLSSMKGKERLDTAASLFRDSAEELGEDIVPVAEILFEDDKTDSSGLRGDAAFVLARSESKLAGKAEDYLKSISGTDKKERYGVLLLSRTTDEYAALVNKAMANRGRELDDPDIARAAAALERKLRAIFPRVAEKQRTTCAVRLQLSMVLALQGKKKEALAELEKTKGFDVPPEKLQVFYRFITNLGERPSGQDGR